MFHMVICVYQRASIYRVVLYVLAINGKMYEPTKQNNFWAGIKASPCSGDSR